jgi:hypothetical protein
VPKNLLRDLDVAGGFEYALREGVTEDGIGADEQTSGFGSAVSEPRVNGDRFRAAAARQLLSLGVRAKAFLFSHSQK